MKIKQYYKNRNYIHYSNCHEDANMIIKYANDNINNILSIASGGDNSFACLLLNPNKVISIDSNITQVYLVELKKTAIKFLQYEEYLILLGVREGNSLYYYNKIKQYLSKDVVDYFDNNIFLIKDVKLLNCGRFEYYFNIFSKKILPLIHSKKIIDKFMNCTTLEEQQDFYIKKFNNFRFKLLFKVFFSKFIMKRLGRDKEYFKYNNGQLSKILKNRFEFGIFSNLNKTNPYLQYVIYNNYLEMPLYLKKENFEMIKNNIDKIEVRCISLDEALNLEYNYDFMNLSDVFEYLDNSLMEKYEEALFNKLNDHGRIIYWNMQNTRVFSHKLIRINTNLKNDRAFYYKDLLVYEKA